LASGGSFKNWFLPQSVAWETAFCKNIVPQNPATDRNKRKNIVANHATAAYLQHAVLRERSSEQGRRNSPFHGLFQAKLLEKARG
jgi:hypothetical protein